MMSSGMLRRVALVRTTRRNIPDDIILHSHRRGNLKSYITQNCFHQYQYSVIQQNLLLLDKQDHMQKGLIHTNTKVGGSRINV
jgi:hypothetical protein